MCVCERERECVCNKYCTRLQDESHNLYCNIPVVCKNITEKSEHPPYLYMIPGQNRIINQHMLHHHAYVC